MARPAKEMTLEERAYLDSLHQALEEYKTFTNRAKHLRGVKAHLRMILRGALEATGDHVADDLIPGVRLWLIPNVILVCHCHGLEAGECPKSLDENGIMLHYTRDGFRFKIDYTAFNREAALNAVQGSSTLTELTETVNDLRIVNDTIDCLEGLAEHRLLILRAALERTGKKSTETLVRGSKLKLTPSFETQCECHGKSPWYCPSARKGETIVLQSVQVDEQFGVETQLGEKVIAALEMAA